MGRYKSLEQIVDTIEKAMLMMKLKMILYLWNQLRVRKHLLHLFHNFMVHFKNTTSELFDAMRKVRDKLQLDLIFKKKLNITESHFTKFS